MFPTNIPDDILLDQFVSTIINVDMGVNQNGETNEEDKLVIFILI